MSDRGDKLQDLNNKGQEDGMDASWDPPNSTFDELFSFGSDIVRKREENDAYAAGYENARNNIKK